MPSGVRRNHARAMRHQPAAPMPEFAYAAAEEGHLSPSQSGGDSSTYMHESSSHLVRRRDASRRPGVAPSRKVKRAWTANECPPPESFDIIASPSHIWNQMPLAARSFLFVFGFLSVYYALFAKHHTFDRLSHKFENAVGTLQSDIRSLIRTVNEEEPPPPFVIPEILQGAQGDTPDSSAARINSTSSAFGLHLSSTNRSSDSRMPQNTESKVSGDSEELARNPRVSTPPSSIGHRRRVHDVFQQAGETGSVVVDRPKGMQLDRRESVNTTNETVLNKNAGAYQSKSGVVAVGGVNSAAGKPKVAKDVGSREPVYKKARVSNSQLPFSASFNADEASSRTESAERNFSVSPLQTKVSHTTTLSDEEALAAFGDPNPKNLLDGTAPKMIWNYEDVLDIGTTEQTFELGNKYEHVAAYKPLCINPETSSAIIMSDKRVCGGYNRTSTWLAQYCNVLTESSRKEYLLESSLEKTTAWLAEQDAIGKVHWVEGLTILQNLDKSCGNIAHFAGRALFLHHIMENIEAYAANPHDIENVLIIPTFHIMKRFLHPHNYEFWHDNFFTAMIAPAKYTIGTLGNFLYREKTVVFEGIPRVQLLHNFSLSGSHVEADKIICFRRAIVPGYLKARFFVDDAEYPSKKATLQNSNPEAPHVPRDSLRIRERVSNHLHQTPIVSKMARRVLFLDRTGSRRTLDPKTKVRILDMFRKVAKEHHHSFETIAFDGTPFRRQYEVMESAAVAIGIHGANLVNTMFMPPLSALFELFPFGFRHNMYEQGSNAGLRYYSYEMSTGTPFKGPRRFTSAAQCISFSHKCKVHYRDAALQVTDIDFAEIERILRLALEWSIRSQRGSRKAPSVEQTRVSRQRPSSENHSSIRKRR